MRIIIIMLTILISACTTYPPGSSSGSLVANPRCIKHCQSVIITQPVDSIGVQVEKDKVDIFNELPM